MANSSMIKDRKYMPPIQEIAIVDNQATYPINSSSIEGLEFLSRKPNEKFYIMVKDADYTLEQVSGVWNITIINTDLLEVITDIQVASALTIESGEYDPIGSVDIVTLKDYYNKLYRDFINLQSFYNINSFLTDGLTDNLVLPSLKPNETWFMDVDGEIKTAPIDIINDSIQNLLGEFKQELDDFTEIQKQELDDFTDIQKNEIDTFTEVKIGQIQQLTEVKINEINEVVDDGLSKLLERVSTSTVYANNLYTVVTTNPREHYQGEIINLTFSQTNSEINPNIIFDSDISSYPLRLLENNQAIDIPVGYIQTTVNYEVNYLGDNFLLYEAGYNIATDTTIGIVKGGEDISISPSGEILIKETYTNKVGWVGQVIGNDKTNTDIQSITAPGFYRSRFASNLFSNLPPGTITAFNLQVMSIDSSSGYVKQVLYEYNTNKIWSCYKIQSQSFSSWQRIDSGATDPVSIGSVLFRADNINPATIYLGSTWQLIEDCAIRATKSTENALDTGGSDSVTLGVDNLPSHTHVFTGVSASVTRGTMDITGAWGINTGIGVVRTGEGATFSGAFYKGTTKASSVYGHSVAGADIEFQASRNWTGSSSAITPTGTNSSTGSGTAFSIVNKYTALKVWRRLS